MNAESLHKLLARQLRRHFGSLEAVPPALHPFLEVVDRAYRQSDEDRALMEHSLETVSAELAERLQRIATVTDEREQVQVALSQLEATIESPTTTLKEVYFPAVTICNINQVLKNEPLKQMPLTVSILIVL